MRLFTKLFICIMAAFGAAFLTAGYFLLGYSLESGVERELAFALRQNQYDRFAVQAGLLENEEGFKALTAAAVEDRDRPEAGSEDRTRPEAGGEDRTRPEAGGGDKIRPEAVSGQAFCEQLLQQVSEPACILDENGTFLAGKDWEAQETPALDLEEGSYCYQIVEGEEASYIFVGSVIEQEELRLGLVTRTDLTQILARQQTLLRYFERFFFAALGVGILLSAALSHIFTAPVKRMTQAADRMAGGCYHERLPIRGRDELAQLADSFNHMAGAVEQTVGELSTEAERKRDFAANLAHELKTPLTSIIGYADRLYQKELPREEEKKAAWYIWNEGMRLEALALKLMDLTNLEEQAVSLEQLRASELLEDIAEGVRPALEKKGIALRWEAGEGDVWVDYDLIKSLLLNLIDNAAKAESRHIRVTGTPLADGYRIAVADDGRGIPEEELTRITEAFYTVDKSRSRRQHGAGLGLALAKRIAELHGGRLELRSREGKGTEAALWLPGRREA